MKENVLSSWSLDEIKKIHKLSLEYNNKINKDHAQRLLELMREHVDEIEALLANNAPHGFVETGDLIILCFELLLENNISIDEIIKKCFNRYNIKLGQLLTETCSWEEKNV